MGNRREADLQRDVLAYLQEQKIWHWRTQMGHDSGLPDIICVICGRFVGIELKREDGLGHTTLQQFKVLKDLNDAGAIADRIDSLDQLKKWVEDIRGSYERPTRAIDIPLAPTIRRDKQTLRMGGTVTKMGDKNRNPVEVEKTVYVCPNCRTDLANNILFVPFKCPSCGQRLKRI